MTNPRSQKRRDQFHIRLYLKRKKNCLAKSTEKGIRQMTTWEKLLYHKIKVNIFPKICVCVLSCVQLFCDPMDCSLMLLCFGDFPGRNTGVGCYSLLQGIFLSQGSNPCPLCPLHWQVDSLSLNHPGKPKIYMKKTKSKIEK